jgi:hypothetical protein
LVGRKMKLEMILLVVLLGVVVVMMVMGKCSMKCGSTENFLRYNPDYEYNHRDCQGGQVHCTMSDGSEGRCLLHNICAPHFSRSAPQPGGHVKIPRA